MNNKAFLSNDLFKKHITAAWIFWPHIWPLSEPDFLETVARNGLYSNLFGRKSTYRTLYHAKNYTLSLGVVEAAGSSPVTQTRNRRMINLPIFFILKGFSALFGCGFFVFKDIQKWEKNRKKSGWYKIWYNVSKSAFHKRVEAVSKFKIRIRITPTKILFYIASLFASVSTQKSW